MLLLRKKKYAGKLVKNYKDLMKRSSSHFEIQTELEIKGLDMKRRDWPQLTKKVSKDVLDILMETNDLSEVLSYLEEVNNVIDYFSGKK